MSHETSTPREGTGGDTIRLFGDGFLPGQTVVMIGGVSAEVEYVATTMLRVLVPSGFTGSAPITISTPYTSVSLGHFEYVSPVVSLTLTPSNAAVELEGTQQFTATGLRSDGTTVDLTALVTWEATPSSVASIDSGGLVVGVAPGPAAISATYETFSANASLTVNAPDEPGGELEPEEIDPTVATSIGESVRFLYEGDDPIQKDVAPGVIDDRRVAVVRGRVLSVDDTPLSGVRVSILERPQFGYTHTRSDGLYDLAINGGGALTLRFAKDGLIPVQRRASLPWRDYVVLDDVYLMEYDENATVVHLSAGAMQVAQGSVVSDDDGSRQATLLIPAGTTATIQTPDGPQSAQTLTIRATEFTVGPNGPRMMPGDLPPASAYTYCVELSADEAVAIGAERIEFSQPIGLYVENFLGFPVGTIVPSGYYDRAQGAWIASDNGVVLEIVGIAGGLAEVDLTGDGAPDDPAAGAESDVPVHLGWQGRVRS